MHDLFHRRPSKRHLAVGLLIVLAVALWAGYYDGTGRQKAATKACVGRALAANKRTGLKAETQIGPGPGQTARRVVEDLCRTSPDAF